jgi:hypothetical protein
MFLLLITDFIKSKIQELWSWFMPKNPWYKRVQREAASMQLASAVIADVIAHFEEQGMYAYSGRR